MKTPETKEIRESVKKIDMAISTRIDLLEKEKKETLEKLNENPLYYIGWVTEGLIETEVEAKEVLRLRKFWEKINQLIFFALFQTDKDFRAEKINEVFEQRRILVEHVERQREELLESPPRRNSTSTMSNLITLKTFETKAQIYSGSFLSGGIFRTVQKELKTLCNSLQQFHENLIKADSLSK